MRDLLNKIKGLKSPKDIDNLELDKKSKLVIVLFCLGIILLDSAFLIRVQMRGVSVISPKVAKLKKDLDELNRNLFAMQDLKNKQAVISRSKAKKIISQDQVALLLENISSAANDCGVKIIQMKPSREALGKGEKVAGAENLLPLSITMDLTCAYHDLGKFLSGLENGDYFVSVQNIRIRGTDQNSVTQAVSLGLRAYVTK